MSKVDVKALVTLDTMTELYRVYAPYKLLGYRWQRVDLDDGGQTVEGARGMVLALHRVLFAGRRNDLVRGTRATIQLFQRQGFRVTWEIDDDWTSVPIHNRGYWGNPQMFEAMTEACRCADAALVTTPHLADRVRRFNPNVIAIPNGVEPEMWGLPSGLPEPADRPVVAIVGSKTHVSDWLDVPDIYVRVKKRFPTVEFRVIGDAPSYFRFPYQRDGGNWRRLPEMLRGASVGLAPLDPTLEFNRSRSDSKFSEYTMAGLATVAQDCVPYRDSIAPGVTGFLASNSQEFADAVCSLLADPDARCKMLCRARDWVIRHRSVRATAPSWQDAYSRISTGRL